VPRPLERAEPSSPSEPHRFGTERKETSICRTALRTSRDRLMLLESACENGGVMKMKTRWLCCLLVLGLVIGVTLLAGSAGAQAVKPTASPTGSCILCRRCLTTPCTFYKAKVGIKGGTTLSNAYSGTGSCRRRPARKLDRLFQRGRNDQRADFLTRARSRVACPTQLGSGRSDRRQRNMDDQGEKWLDPAHGTTEPFTCGGTIVSTAPPGNMSYKATRTASNIKFTLQTQTVQLTNKPPEACPNDSRAASLGGSSRTST